MAELQELEEEFNQVKSFRSRNFVIHHWNLDIERRFK